MNISIKTYDKPTQWIGYAQAEPFTIFFPADGGDPVLHNSRAIKQDENGNACATCKPSEWPELARHLRQLGGMSQAEIAAALGYKSAATVSMWESKQREINVSELDALATALGYDIELRLIANGG